MSTTDYKYIYGVVLLTEPKNFGRVGIDDQEVYAVNQQNIAAVVSNTSVIDYPSLDKEVLILKLAAHQSVTEKIMQYCSILPFKFGTVVRNDSEIREILKKNQPLFSAALAEILDKIELEVVVSWHGRSVYDDILQENKEIMSMKEALAKKPKPSLQDKVQLGKKVSQALIAKSQKYAQGIQETLGELAIDQRRHRILPEILLNTAYLIKREHERVFYQRLTELNQKYEDQLTFKCVGPLPPYSFKTLQLIKMDEKNLNRARRLLGIDKRTTFPEFKEKYWQLVQQYHPDRRPADKEKFTEILQARQILSDYYQFGKYRCSFLETEFEKQSSII